MTLHLHPPPVTKQEHVNNLQLLQSNYTEVPKKRSSECLWPSPLCLLLALGGFSLLTFCRPVFPSRLLSAFLIMSHLFLYPQTVWRALGQGWGAGFAVGKWAASVYYLATGWCCSEESLGLVTGWGWQPPTKEGSPPGGRHSSTASPASYTPRLAGWESQVLRRWFASGLSPATDNVKPYTFCDWLIQDGKGSGGKWAGETWSGKEFGDLGQLAGSS